MQPDPAAVIAWRYRWSWTSPHANTPGTLVFGAVVRDEIAVRVHLELAAEQRRVRVVADRDEHSRDRHFLALAGRRVPDDHRGDFALAGILDLVDLGVEQPLDLRVCARLVLHDFRRAQRVAAMHEGHLARELGEEHRFFHRRIAAADDRDLVAAEEVPVARRARRDAVAHQLFLRVKSEQLR